MFNGLEAGEPMEEGLDDRAAVAGAGPRPEKPKRRRGHDDQNGQ